MRSLSVIGQAALISANAYLFIFAADAALALADALAGGGSLAGASSWRWPTMTMTLEGALPLYLLLGFSPLLPKRALLAPPAFLLWAWFGALPIGLSSDPNAGAMSIAGVQLLVSAATFLSIRRYNAEGGWLITATTTGRPSFRLGYTLKYFVAGLVVLPPLLSVLTLAYAGTVIVHSAGGFLSFEGDGVYAEEREYVRDNKTVYLIGMVHVADRSFYEEVFSDLPMENSVILAEGVSDRSGLFDGDLSGRDDLAALGGLTSQTDVPMPSHAVIEVADVDADELSESSVEFVNALIAALNAGDLREAAERMRPYFKASRIDDAVSAVDELIAVRNARVLEKLTSALDRYDHVIVPWGAAHMPGIERGVLDRGFDLARRRPRRVFAFGRNAVSDG